MKKLAIVINGAGGVGKDTLCDFAAKHYKTLNVSTITPIKEIAADYGMTESNVKVMLHRTRQSFKAYLEKEGIEI